MQGNIKYIITRLISGFYKKTEIQNKFKESINNSKIRVTNYKPKWYNDNEAIYNENRKN